MGGNIIQNTRKSVELAHWAGADRAEIDVCRSKDGIYYLFHNGNEERLLNLPKDFHDLTLDEIESAEYLNYLGGLSGYRVERLIDFLE